MGSNKYLAYLFFFLSFLTNIWFSIFHRILLSMSIVSKGLFALSHHPKSQEFLLLCVLLIWVFSSFAHYIPNHIYICLIVWESILEKIWLDRNIFAVVYSFSWWWNLMKDSLQMLLSCSGVVRMCWREIWQFLFGNISCCDLPN